MAHSSLDDADSRMAYLVAAAEKWAKDRPDVLHVQSKAAHAMIAAPANVSLNRGTDTAAVAADDDAEDSCPGLVDLESDASAADVTSSTTDKTDKTDKANTEANPPSFVHEQFGIPVSMGMLRLVLTPQQIEALQSSYPHNLFVLDFLNPLCRITPEDEHIITRALLKAAHQLICHRRDVA